MHTPVSRSSYEVTLLQENRDLRDDNTYLRKKLASAYKDAEVDYPNLLKQWKSLLVKSVIQQDEIAYLTHELGKTKLKKW